LKIRVSVVRFRPRPPSIASRESDEVQKPSGTNALGLFVVRERPQSSGLNQSLLQ